MFKKHKIALSIGFLAAALGPAVNFYIPLYLRDIGLDVTQIGFLAGFTVLISFLVLIPIGLFNDRFESRFFILIGLILMGLAHFGITIWTSFSAIILLFILKELGQSFFGLSIDSLILKTKDDTKTLLPIYIFGTSFLSGVMKIIMGITMIFISLSLVIQYVGIVYFLLIILAIYLPKTTTFKLNFNDYKKDILDKKVLIFLSIMFLFALHFGPEAVNYGLFLEEVFDLNKAEMGIYMGIPIILLAFSSYYYGQKLKDGFKSYKVLVYGLLFNGIGHIIQIVPILSVSFIGRSIHEIGDGAVFIFMYNGLSLLFPKHRIGGNLGLIRVATVAGFFISSVVAGIIAENYNHSIPFLVAGIFCIGASILSYYYKDTLTH